MIYTLPARPAPLPVASAYVDRELLRQLLAEPSKIAAYAEILPDRCRHLQDAVARGGFYLKKELRAVQTQAQTVLKAARACRELTSHDLRNLDLLTAFVRGIELPARNGRAA